MWQMRNTGYIRGIYDIVSNPRAACSMYLVFFPRKDTNVTISFLGCISHVAHLYFNRVTHFLSSSKWRLHRKRILTSNQVERGSLPGVSIIKPLCNGGDQNLFANLETFFTLDYPKVRVRHLYITEGRDRSTGSIQRKKYP